MPKKKKKKSNIEKRKPTLSKEYKAVEEEVNAIISKSTLDSSEQSDNISRQVEFFTKCVEEHQSPISTIEESSSKNSNASGSEELESLPPAASYIQIDDFEIIRQIQFEKIIFDRNLLYIPNTNEKICTEDIEAQNQKDLEKGGIYVEQQDVLKGKNMIKMVNRMFEEGKCDLIFSSSRLKKLLNFNIFPDLYITECERVFEPIFHTISIYQEQPIIASDKRVLTISLKELNIIVHPIQTEEHKLAKKVKELYSTYHEKESQNIVNKLTSELTTIREIINDLLKKSNEFDLGTLEEYMDQARNLRNTLHREELSQKTLLKMVLETWVALKKTRKKQGYNWTTLKLLIKKKEINSNEEEKSWNERLKIELNEVLWEEYTSYYQKKRSKKQKDGHDLHKPDEKHIRNRLRETLINCSRLPKEPKLQLAIGKILAPNKSLEKKIEYYFKIFLDTELLETTRKLQLTDEFIVPVDKTFSILLDKKIPDGVKIEIYEVKKLPPDFKLAELYLPISIAKNISSDIEETLNFTSHNSKIIGELKILTSFSVLEPHLNEGDLEPSLKSKRKTEISQNVLKSWYDNQLINPLDPDCIPILKKLNKIEVVPEALENDNNFVFNEELLQFCSNEDIQNNQRLTLLRSRYRNNLKYKNYKFVPVFDNELEDENEEKVIEEGNWMDSIDLQKHKGKKYLKKLYETVQNHCMKINRTESNSTNLLIENESPTISSVISSILSLFRPSRTLSPPKSSQTSYQAIGLTNFNLVVNIVRATGIPVRNFTTISARRNSSASFSHHTLRYTNVNPYICVTYKDKTVRTLSAEGSNPTWNEQLVLSISGNQQEFKEDVKFRLFDEYVEDLISDDSTRAMEVYQRIHTNWLGELQLPLSVIFSSQNIEGVFEIDSPKLLLGYSQPPLDPTEVGNQSENVPEIKEIIYLWLYVHIEPQYEISKVNMTHLECSELKEVKEHIQEWCIQIKNICPERFIDPLICLSNGKKVCITRLLEPIPLPIKNNDDIESYIRRYVSLIPIYKQTNSCTGLNGVWLSNQLILDTLWATPKDLGVLLTCFYLSSGIRAWLVIGIAFLYGGSTFTLLKENNEYIFVNPHSGKKYSTKDVYCPISQVFYIVGQDNVYCNLQFETRVSLTNFNLDDSRCWLPLFDKNNPAPIGGVHNLNYDYKLLLSTVELRKNIERKIMKKINSWRATRKTVWNRAFQSIMYKILAELEHDVIHERNSEDYLEKLAQLIPTYKLFGFTLNFSYINLQAISDRIRSTGIHLNTNKNVEYSVAVHIHQYPNNFLSVWIFLVSAVPIR